MAYLHFCIVCTKSKDNLSFRVSVVDRLLEFPDSITITQIGEADLLPDTTPKHHPMAWMLFEARMCIVSCSFMCSSGHSKSKIFSSADGNTSAASIRPLQLGLDFPSHNSWRNILPPPPPFSGKERMFRW